MRTIVYTANINNYDTRKPVPDIDGDIQYLYYSENINRLEGWKMIRPDMSLHEDIRKVSRYYKTNSHLLPPHDYSVWIDASFQLHTTSVQKFIQKHLGEHDIACFFHDKDLVERSCIYQEVAACINKFPNDTMCMLDQINRYRDEGFPQRFGLRSAGIILRKNNDKVKEFNEAWWNEIDKGSHRDQLSQMYVSWKTGIDVGKITDGNVYINALARYHYHIHKIEELRNKTIFKRTWKQ